MLTCYRVRRRLGAYLDGALDEGASAVAGAHLETCARCQAELDGLRRLSAMLRRGLPPAAPDDWTGFWEGIRRGIETPRGQAVVRERPRLLWRPRFAVGAVAAVVLAVSVAVWQMPRGTVTPGADSLISVSSADTDDPGGAVMVYSPPEKDLAVVWLLTAR